MSSVLLVLASGQAAAEVDWRPAYIEGGKGASAFVLHEVEPGFSELQHLFLATLTQSTAARKCCASKDSWRSVSLVLRAPYYVKIGREQVLIERLDIRWPRRWGKPGGPSPMLILNGSTELIPAVDDKNLELISVWAKGRKVL